MGAICLSVGLQYRASVQPMRERAKEFGIIRSRLHKTMGDAQLTATVTRKVGSTHTYLGPLPIGNSRSQGTSMLMRPLASRMDRIAKLRKGTEMRTIPPISLSKHRVSGFDTPPSPPTHSLDHHVPNKSRRITTQV